MVFTLHRLNIHVRQSLFGFFHNTTLTFMSKLSPFSKCVKMNPLQQSSNSMTYYLANHPTIVNFRWSHSQSWGSTWSFLVSSLLLYVLLSITLHLILLLFRRRKPVPLGPLPSLHSFLMAAFSLLIFLGIIVSAASEINESRWLWKRIRTTPFQWLLCFPIGTRPSGRVFFWSYLFYISRYFHLLRTFFTILERKGGSLVRVLVTHCALVCMSFLWLEFSQSFQVIGVLISTMAHVVVFGNRFWVDVGGKRCSSEVVLGCQVALLGVNLLCHFGVLVFHFVSGGCNGIGAWGFNAVLNGIMMFVFVNWYVRRGGLKEKGFVDAQHE